MPQRHNCTKCDDTGVLPKGTKARPCECRADVSNVHQAATIYLEWVCSRDPSYRTRVQTVREKGFSDEQILGRFCSYVLRNSLQNETTDDPLFANGVSITPERAKCAECRRPFKPQWPQQKTCSNACTERARARGILLPASSPQPRPEQRRTVAPNPDAVRIEQAEQRIAEAEQQVATAVTVEPSPTPVE